MGDARRQKKKEKLRSQIQAIQAQEDAERLAQEQEQKGGKVRLMLDFLDMDLMLAWFYAAKENGSIPPGVEIIKRDTLDDLSETGITRNHCYIVRREGDRPYGRLK
ncbi:MAG: hypothetical protein ACREGR_02790 [Minisyncoccia bacterium]